MALLPPPSVTPARPKLRPPAPGATRTPAAQAAAPPSPVTGPRGEEAAPKVAASELEELLSTMESMPSNPTVAMRVLWVADDPRASASELANILELDPALTARVLRTANSAYYSMGSRVTNVPRAVVTVGFATVQALAAAAVTGLDSGADLPENFWEHSAQVAHATGLVARHFGVASNDAFAAGLLHDLGEGIMCRLAPEVWHEIESGTRPNTAERLASERAAYGTNHAEVVERILRAWHLPESLCAATGSHHDPTASTTPLGAALLAGTTFAQLVCGDLPDDARDAAVAELAEAGLTEEFIDKVVARLEAETKVLAEAFR